MTELEVAARMLAPKTIPVTVGALPSAWFHYGDELKRIALEYPQFFKKAWDPDELREAMSPRYHVGEWVDEWGCVWSNVIEGNEAYVTGHPIKSEADIFSMEIPQNRDGNLYHGFFYLRMLDLCGFDLAMILFAEEDEALQALIHKVLTYNCYQIEALLKNHSFHGDYAHFYYFADDLGMQNGLAIGAERWRKYLKPAYKKMYDLVHRFDPDAAILMHTDGCIWEIMPDLIEAGVTMINPQFRANGLEHLVDVCRSKQIIPLHLDLDRQMFAFSTPAQLQEHVRSCVQSLYLPEGGLALNVEFSREIPLENIVALLDALEKWRHYKG